MKTSKTFLLIILVSIISIVSGVLMTLILDKHEDVHYHANIAIFVNGEKVNLSLPKYMEETTKCAVDPSKQRPEDRTHFHENDGDLVHIHSAGVTWGHLMSNIGWAFGENYLLDDTGKMTQKSSSGSIHFILNGKSVENPWNHLIASEDRLLLSYSNLTDDELIAKEFPLVAKTAGEANKKDDPTSCGGGTAVGFFDMVRERLIPHEH